MIDYEKYYEFDLKVYAGEGHRCSRFYVVVRVVASSAGKACSYYESLPLEDKAKVLSKTESEFVPAVSIESCIRGLPVVIADIESD